MVEIATVHKVHRVRLVILVEEETQGYVGRVRHAS